MIGRSTLVTVLAIAFLFSAASSARAQDGANGTIVGNVFDQTGVPLKGVKISATSPTQIGGSKRTYTNDEGYFRIIGLQPGEFTVEASAPKLAKVIQKGIQVGISAAAEISVIMEVETTTEEVKVVEKAPIVSTTTANVKEVYDEEFVDGLPTEDKHQPETFVQNSVPGVAGGGSRTFRARGGGDNQASVMLDGFFTKGLHSNYKSMAAMEVQTAGYGADGAVAPGGMLNMVTKSGSNKYEMDVSGFWEDSILTPFKEETDQVPRRTTLEFSPNFSGPIIKDRVWFYLNTQLLMTRLNKEQDPSGFFPEAPPRRVRLIKGTLKLTWQVTGRNKLQFIQFLNDQIQSNYQTGNNVTPEAQRRNHGQTSFTGLTWESLLTDEIFFKNQVGTHYENAEWGPQRCTWDPDCDNLASIQQTFPRTIQLQNFNEHFQRGWRSWEFISQLEWFKHSKALGDHNVKLASRYYIRQSFDIYGIPGDQRIFYAGAEPQRTEFYYSNDPRLEPERKGFVIRVGTGKRWVNTLTDSWKPTRYLSINPGVAYTIATAENNQGDVIIENAAATPHISAAYDITHDGRTVVRGSFNNYLDTDLGRLAQFSIGDQVSKNCRYNATNGLFDSNCVYSGGVSGRTIGLPCGSAGVDTLGNPCKEKLKIPRTWEYTLGAEREIVQGVGFGTDFIYRRFNNQYEKTETNRIWNSAGSALDETGQFRNGVAQNITNLGTPDGAYRRYIGVTTSFHKREGALKANASYTWSKSNGTVFNDENNPWGDIGPRDIYLDSVLQDDQRHVIKATSTYQWTRYLTTGLTWSYASGAPYSRFYRNVQTGAFEDVRAPRGINPGNNINDPGDDRQLRLPDIQKINFQVRVNLKPLTGINMDVYGDMLNVLALRTVTDVVDQDGPSFGQTSTLMAPTTVRFGFRFRY
jgi:hypothetical protein